MKDSSGKTVGGLVPVGDVIIMFPNGLTCSNEYFNDGVKHADEFSVTPKCIDIVNDELDNELFLAAVAAGTAFKKYEDKRQVSTVLFEMVLDEKEEAYGIPTLHDTEEYKKQQAAKEKEKRKKERLQRKKQEAVETNEDGGKNQN